jgi:hypothetical protein
VNAARARSRVLAGLSVAATVAALAAGVTVLGAQAALLAAFLAYAARESAAEARRDPP